MMVTTGHENTQKVVKIVVYVCIKYSDLHIYYIDIFFMNNKP